MRRPKDDFYIITADEVKEMRDLAHARDEADKANGALDMTNVTNPIGRAIMANIAELAVSISLGIPMYKDLVPRREDFTLPSGRTMDVKSIYHSGLHRMHIPHYKEFKGKRCDVYTLVAVGQPDPNDGSVMVWILGWLEAEKVFEGPVLPGVTTDQFIVPREALRPWGDLFNE